jgi:hypothetical protein
MKGKINLRIGLVIFVVGIIFLYLLISILNVNKKNQIEKEKFGVLDDTTPDLIPTTTAYKMPTVMSSIIIEQNSATSLNITEGIANLLGISPRRVKDLGYADKISRGQLDVSFTIDEPNFLENHTGAITTENAHKTLDNLIATNMFKIKINNSDVMLNKSSEDISNPNNSETSNLSSKVKPAIARYFNNTALLNIADHAKKTYDTVPYDESVTKFFKLSIDPVYNVHIDHSYTA